MGWYEKGLRRDEKGLRRDEKGLRRDEKGLRKDWKGMSFEKGWGGIGNGLKRS